MSSPSRRSEQLAIFNAAMAWRQEVWSPTVAQVDLRFSPDQDAFRTEVRDWLTAHAPKEHQPAAGRALVDYQRAWPAELAGVALVAVHWPRAFGGRSLGWTESFIVQEEIALAHAPEI